MEADKRRQSDTIEKQLTEMSIQLTTLMNAFPDGPEKHRAAHIAMMETAASQKKAAEAEERFYNEIKLDLAKKGVVALVVFIFGLIVLGATIALSAKLGIMTLGVK